MAEKDQKPTAKRLREAREKGDVPKSAETISSAFFVGVCVALAVGIGALFARLQALFRLVFDAVGAADPSARIAVLIDGAAREWATLSAQIVAAGLLAGLLAGFVQVGGVMAWSRLVPQLSRLNPAEGMKNLWSLRNLVNLAKMLLKTALLVATLGWLIVESLDPSVQSGFTRPISILALIVKLLMLLFGWAALIYIVMALIDIMHQRHEFNQKMKMSIDEVRREHKEDEGDPHIEAKRRQLAREVQFASLSDRIGYASVVVYSPRVAVALYYGGIGTLPWVLARGEGDAAERIVRAARDELRPTLANVGLAQALYETTPENGTIQPQHFREVAQLLKWATGAG
ncbi:MULTISPECIES: EscU/YscU/HrcU family type III secretion system export apparatus switch protein [Burkholderia]|jgi:type III secretion protein U|uniref:EscU/YscU/HrcU family type III secretion system export apparatus switch protein n=2 Tax=Burkholderia contaminans TaxID=488447 RepID=A0A1E3FUV5_9BURK|nr:MULTISPECIES: EscU/YscU/HrcU family type III secretion system export apparatus switch protein [Burkholderia]UTP26103.1 EscU/YscU/HrcU family type III secretion system export apparatus switch protein [Burkholderia sp. FXe9]KKL29363.1 type III secretion protein [Burkholderia contaminans LMG 23361]MBA9834991.1 EscU/YscU/HrcU family type III secretion system export apparatus switch protein [Burkholderia contaminans]MBA9838383.1 EscU/YscU/HrcU family type III secretion system export apparatus swi